MITRIIEQFDNVQDKNVKVESKEKNFNIGLGRVMLRQDSSETEGLININENE